MKKEVKLPFVFILPNSVNVFVDSVSLKFHGFVLNLLNRRKTLKSSIIQILGITFEDVR